MKPTRSSMSNSAPPLRTGQVDDRHDDLVEQAGGAA